VKRRFHVFVPLNVVQRRLSQGIIAAYSPDVTM
jgi:hypothetical protein